MSSDLPGIADLLQASRRLHAVAVRTPLLESERLNRIAGRRILVKAECLQRGGSFKFRGAWNHIAAVHPTLDGRPILAVSSGNHAQGVARAAAMMEVPATIVMPADAPAPKLHGTKSYGAEVVTYDRDSGPREEIAERERANRNAHMVPPYDDPLVIAGQGTVGLEITEQVHRLGIHAADVLIPCSGGGLAAGCALAFESESPGLRVRPVEPAGFDDWARSLAKGERDENAAPSGSLCDALLAETPGRITWAVGHHRFGPGLVVSDDEALRAVAAAWRYLRIVLEPSGATALAAALALPDGDKPAIVVASGGNVSVETFTQAVQSVDESTVAN